MANGEAPVTRTSGETAAAAGDAATSAATPHAAKAERPRNPRTDPPRLASRAGRAPREGGRGAREGDRADKDEVEPPRGVEVAIVLPENGHDAARVDPVQGRDRLHRAERARDARHDQRK